VKPLTGVSSSAKHDDRGGKDKKLKITNTKLVLYLQKASQNFEKKSGKRYPDGIRKMIRIENISKHIILLLSYFVCLRFLFLYTGPITIAQR
jgi:hypothetical protein